MSVRPRAATDEEPTTTLTVPLYTLRMVKERTLFLPVSQVGMPNEAAALLHALLDDSDRERVYVISLDARCHVVGIHEVSVGGVSMCSVDIRNVLKPALLSNASFVLLGHNHTSRDARPSREDLAMTERTKIAAEIVGTPLVDHVIVARGSSYSFHEHGEL